MDLDAFSAARGAGWERLARLAERRRLRGAEADELIERYQAGATDLSVIQTTVGSSAHGDRLSLALSRARLHFTGVPAEPLRQVTEFFTHRLPAAFYRVRWLSLAVAAATAVLFLVFFTWYSSDPRVLATLGSPAQLEEYATQQFVGYYDANSEAGFTGQVWTNNAWLAAQCIMFGIFGLWTPVVLMQTGSSLGISAAVMNEYGRLDHFFLYIAPHGQLELYSVFVAGAAGLMIFWSWIAPGARTRRQALAEDGRALFTLVIGLTLTLLISGVIEGVVTRQDWPWPLKIGIGTVALALVLVYQWVVGRRAYRAGVTGDLDEADAGARQIVSS
ncbi:MAG: stage II sporulation protein M [Microbacteriaceae bacterium]|nr:stage II sporulation protein M [Microbacteriaceae bacterium]